MCLSLPAIRRYVVLNRAYINSLADETLLMKPVEKQVGKAFGGWIGSVILNTEAILHESVKEICICYKEVSISECFQLRTMLVCIIITVFDVNTVVLSLTSATLYITLEFQNQQGLRFPEALTNPAFIILFFSTFLEYRGQTH